MPSPAGSRIPAPGPSAARHGPHAARRPVIRLVRRRKATSSAYRRLRDLIVSGRLAPGAPLVECELTERLGVSRTPVRAALQRLQQEGFATSARAGTMLRAVVAPLTAGDMREVFLMTAALESAAARLAAGLEPARRDALAATLDRRAADLRESAAVRPPDVGRVHDLRVRVHRTFTVAGAGPRLLAELDVLQPQAERYQRVYTSAIVHAPEEAAREHDAIIAAIRAGDRDEAERAVTRHWRASAERCGRAVTILGERGNW